jgi:hypothetical protein
VVPQINALSQPLYDADRPLSPTYIALGDRDGRAALIRGDAQFAISGRPPSADDEAALKQAGKSLIEAPFALTSIQFIMAAPFTGTNDPIHPPGIQTVTVVDPSDPDNSPVIKTDLPSPFRLTNSLVARSYLLGQGPWGTPALNALIQQQYPGANLYAYARPATQIARSDPGAVNYYLEEFLKAGDPDAWAQAVSLAGVQADALSETFPFFASLGNTVPTRAGDAAVGATIGGWLDSASAFPPFGGLLGPVSAATAKIQFQDQVDKAKSNKAVTPLYSIAIQNKHGDFVTATPDVLTATAALGDGQALYGLNEDVPGVYPLTYVNNIYVPSSGLTIDQANGIATLMRVQAGAGQDLEVALGEGKLPTDLLAKTQSSADEVVRDNCNGAGGKVTTIPGGGEFWPKSVAEPTQSVVCVADTKAPASAGSAGGGAPVPGGSGNEPLGSTDSQSRAGGAVSPSGTGSTGTSTSSQEIASSPPTASSTRGNSSNEGGSATGVLASLPLLPPSDGRYALDRLSTMMLGGAAFLVLRKLVRGRSAL